MIKKTDKIHNEDRRNKKEDLKQTNANQNDNA